CDLMIQLRCHDFGQQLSSFYVVADIDLALVDVATGARENICVRERRGGGRQSDDFGTGARPHGRDSYLWNQVAARLQGGHHLTMLLIVAPCARSQRRSQRKGDAEE